MAQSFSTVMLKGGLNLITPAIAIPPGHAIASINYEPDIAGYSRMGGFERFDGQPRPSDYTSASDISAARAAISEVPGTGPVRGVWVYAGNVYAFRDSVDGAGKMFRASSAGWVEMSFGMTITFTGGVTEFLEGEIVVGGTSGATATIVRVVLRSGAWDGSAAGFLVVDDVVGTFQAENITSSAGDADATVTEAIQLPAGGIYDFTNHNFYGAAKSQRMYFLNGEGYAFEWDGETLAPIRPGVDAGIGESVSLTERDGDTIITRAGNRVVMRVLYDKPLWITHYGPHLILGYRAGSLILSSLGLPLQYITTLGAGEISVGEEITGLLTSAGALVVFCQNRIEYITGTSSADFVMQSLSAESGATARSVQLVNSPVFLDDGGIRNLSTTSAFGDWRSGTMSQLVEPLIRAKRDSGVGVAASLRVKAKDQYRLYFDDGTGVTMYVGRETPEVMPFNIPIEVMCACSGEVTSGRGDRLFVGAMDGFVYEIDRGTSFDGAMIPAYIRLPFNSMGAAYQDKRWHKVTFEMSTPDDIEIGMAFDIDYARGNGGEQVDMDVESGAPMVSTDRYDDIDWTVAQEGILEAHIDGIGRNIAVTLITESADTRAHTLSSANFNFSYRAPKR